MHSDVHWQATGGTTLKLRTEAQLPCLQLSRRFKEVTLRIVWELQSVLSTPVCFLRFESTRAHHIESRDTLQGANKLP